jgi:hypothetical protein
MSTGVSIDRSAQPLLAELATSKENPRIIIGCGSDQSEKGLSFLHGFSATKVGFCQTH